MAGNFATVPVMELNERLKRWREGSGLTLEEGAVRLGCSSSSLRNYENGSEPKNRAFRYRMFKILDSWEKGNV